MESTCRGASGNVQHMAAVGHSGKNPSLPILKDVSLELRELQQDTLPALGEVKLQLEKGRLKDFNTQLVK